MMAQDIVGGLFGINTQDVMRQQSNAEVNNALSFANLGPRQQAQYGGYLAGQMLGRGAAGLLGAEDPRLKQARVIESAKQQGFDPTTYDGAKALAQYFVQNGEPSLATAVMDKAQEMSRGAAEEQYKLAQAQASLKDKLPNAAKELIAAGYAPDSPEFQAKMRQIVEAGITGKAKGDGVSVNLGGVFDKMFTKQQADTEGKAVAERMDKLGSVVANVPQRTRDIDTIMKVLPDSFTGFGATQLKDLSKAAKQLGIPVSDKASNTEILNALTTRFVLDLGKVFPGSQSNYELQTIQNTQPNALQDPKTIKRLLQQAKQDYRIAQEQYNDAQKYKKANQGSFAGYDLPTGQAQAGQRVIAQDEYETLSAKAARTGRLTPQEAARAKQLEQQLNIGR